ncbi:MAG: ester cyclase, partial [Pseudomonadota bacterium]
MRSYETAQRSGARPITRVATASEPEMLNPASGRRMDLPGFEDRFVDFPDYIFRITDDIWHKRDLEYIADCYAEDCIIHTQTQTGVVTPTRTVIDATAATLESFPDRRLDADNVIWSRDPDPQGDYFYSSHRLTSKMTNLGPTEFGPATGRKVRVVTFADTKARNNDIFEEWLVRDYGGMVVQLGLDPMNVAKELALQDKKA